MTNEDDFAEDEAIMKKVSMLGDLAVGKTSLVNRFVFNVFGDEYISTIGTKVVKKKLVHKDKNVILMIWDIAGETTFNHIRKAYFKGAKAGLLVADITRKETIDNISDWISSFQEITKNSPVLILINKSDLKENYALNIDEARKLTEKYDTKVLFTSAKTGDNVETAFHEITGLLFSESGQNEKE